MGSLNRLAECQTQKESLMNTSCILELEKNQMLPETEPEQETVRVYSSSKGKSGLAGTERQDTVGSN